MNKHKVLYFMGAGRSGTTALSIFLSRAEQIINLGEIVHLSKNDAEDCYCSCGRNLTQCNYWSKYKELAHCFRKAKYITESFKLEHHSSLINHIFTQKSVKNKNYNKTNSELFKRIGGENKIVLDSSKYLCRAICLNRIEDLDVYYVYLIRDPRGVAHSFGKRVQTQRSLLSAVLYYTLVNAAAELVSRCVLKPKVLKLRYEDLINYPSEALRKIERHCGIDLSVVITRIENGESFEVGHLVGGNRIVAKQHVKLKKTISWRNELPFFKQMLVYILTLPLNVLNRYKF